MRRIVCLLLLVSASCTGLHVVEVSGQPSSELQAAYLAKEEAVVRHLRSLLEIHERSARHLEDMLKSGRGVSQQDLDKHLATVLETKLRLVEAEFHLAAARDAAKHPE